MEWVVPLTVSVFSQNSLTRSRMQWSKLVTTWPFICTRISVHVYSFYFSLLKLRQDGSLKRLQARTWPATESESGTSWQSVDIMEVISVPIVLAVGTVVSVLLLVAELTHHRVRYKNGRHDGTGVGMEGGRRKFFWVEHSWHWPIVTSNIRRLFQTHLWI
jgi:hypothetical protein